MWQVKKLTAQHSKSPKLETLGGRQNFQDFEYTTFFRTQHVWCENERNRRCLLFSSGHFLKMGLLKGKNPPSWIVPQFEIFSKAVFCKILLLLGTTKRGRVFEKSLF
jgi:hypothetical protein